MEKEYLEQLLSIKQISLCSKHTLMSYTNSITHLEHFFPTTKCSEISIQDIKKFIAKYSQEWKRSTLILCLSHIKSYFKWLYEKRYIPENIFLDVKLPKGENTGIEILNQKELITIDKVAKDLGVPLLSRTLYWLIKDTGLRAKELGIIELKDVNLAENLIYVRKTKGRKVTKLVCFSDYTKRVLKQWIATNPDPWENKFLFKSVQGDTFCSRLVYRYIQPVFGSALRENFNKKHGPHMLRHIAATQWVANGGDLEALRIMMGWTSFDMLQKYVHYSPEMIKKKFKEAHRKNNSI